MGVAKVSLVIDGRQIFAERGASILQACESSGINLPTLCHLDGISEYGGCRLCMVEVEGGRRPAPACSTPVSDGMIIKTSTQRLVEYRRSILELLMSERNHFCFFCEKSGDCELQALFYEFGIDHQAFPPFYPRFPLDLSTENIGVDNSRCILCGRCVRVCSEVVGINSLDFVNRGPDTVVIEPGSIPLSEQGCIECGACAEACPTGAIFTRLDSYRGRNEQCDVIRTTCVECPMACDMRVYRRDNNIVRISGGGLGGRYGGQLCRVGRFDVPKREFPRIKGCYVSGRSCRAEVDLPEAADAAVSGLRSIREKYGAESIAGIISTRCTNESIERFRKFLSDEIGTDRFYVLESRTGIAMYKELRRIRGNARMEVAGLLEADTVILIGLMKDEPNPIISSAIRRAYNRGATIVSIEDGPHLLSRLSHLRLELPSWKLEIFIKVVLGNLETDCGDDAIVDGSRACGIPRSQVSALLDCIGEGKRVAVVAGLGLPPERGLISSLVEFSASLGDRGGIVGLLRGGNSMGALDMLKSVEPGDLPRELDRQGIRGAYVLLSDEEPEFCEGLELGDLDTLVIQASYHSGMTRAADIVLPSRIWSERSGSTTGLDGMVRPLRQITLPPEGMASDRDVIGILSSRWEGG